jgi:beta-lactamase superfamily II metal-dependent hydrolase
VIIISASEVPPQERARRELRERLEIRGTPVFYTSDDGAVTITLSSNGWEISSMSGKRYSAARRPEKSGHARRSLRE